MANNKVFQNAKWIIGCKIVQSILQLVIGMLTARYLGPSNYGLIGYASSVVAFTVPIMQLGLRSTLVQEFLDNPKKEGQIIGTSLVMNIVSAVACMISVSIFVLIVNAGETETFIVCLFYSFTLIFQAIEMIQYWFQYKLLSKYPSVAMLCAYFIVSLYKIYLFATAKSVYWFVLSYSLEYAIIGIALIVIYKKSQKQKFSFSFELAKKMFSRSKYYIVSTMMVTIFAHIDHIMIKLMVSETENGFYSAAVTCAGMANFVYAAIIDSARPVILGSKKDSVKKFENNVSKLYSVIIYMGLLESIFFTVFSELIVFVLYGQDYSSTAPMLRIVIWYVAFSYMGTVRNIWILAQEKQKWLWIINLSGALMNIALNAVMIPIWGGCGAALASVLTQFFANVIIGFILKPIRRNNVLLLKGLNPMLLKGLINKKYIKNNK